MVTFSGSKGKKGSAGLASINVHEASFAGVQGRLHHALHIHRLNGINLLGSPVTIL